MASNVVGTIKSGSPRAIGGRDKTAQIAHDPAADRHDQRAPIGRQIQEDS